ncbi:MAG: hypothetical protein ACMZ7B_09095 [Balneola sp.]
MGFLVQAAKTIKHNRQLQRKKTFFKELGKSKATRSNSHLDIVTLQRKSKIIYQRKYRRTLVSRVLIIPFVIISLVLLFWMIYTNFNF